MPYVISTLIIARLVLGVMSMLDCMGYGQVERAVKRSLLNTFIDYLFKSFTPLLRSSISESLLRRFLSNSPVFLLRQLVEYNYIRCSI
jgi:hypothetical protein